MQPRNWGKEKQVFPTIAFLELVSNDYPERWISLNGTYTKQFGYSCFYDKARTPSCVHCQLQRMDIILNDSVNVALEPCEVCSDWWAKVKRGSKYPMPPGGDLTKVGNVELSFELIANSLKDLEIWYRENKRQEGALAYTTKYM